MQTYNLSEAADKLGCHPGCLSWAIDCRLVPLPDLVNGRRRLYSEARLAKVTALLTKHKGNKAVYLCRDAARILGIPSATFRDWLKRGLVPHPKQSTGKRLKYTLEEIEAIREAGLPKERNYRQVEGHYNQAQAAELLGVPRITFQYWLRHGSIPQPRHEVGQQYPYYSANDLETIRATKADYFAIQQIKK